MKIYVKRVWNDVSDFYVYFGQLVASFRSLFFIILFELVGFSIKCILMYWISKSPAVHLYLQSTNLMTAVFMLLIFFIRLQLLVQVYSRMTAENLVSVQIKDNRYWTWWRGFSSWIWLRRLTKWLLKKGSSRRLSRRAFVAFATVLGTRSLLPHASALDQPSLFMPHVYSLGLKRLWEILANCVTRKSSLIKERKCWLR